ncbi:MAG: helix-turn-helix domain-containing protein [Gammaproteobacteria bacterium]|nr:helix-turn-helix domain-containing protein [Gammaproteobacteria bacterium]
MSAPANRRHALSGPSRAALSRLGADLAFARIRRGFSLREAAGRLYVSVNTLRKLEAGNPGVSLGALVNALQLYGLLDQLPALADPATDRIGLALERRTLRRGAKGAADFDV